MYLGSSIILHSIEYEMSLSISSQSTLVANLRSDRRPIYTRTRKLFS